MSLWRSPLTLAEFKILDTYISRIDSHHPENRTVIFDKGELESILGVKSIKYEELKKRMVHLMGNVIEIRDPNILDPKDAEFVTLFDYAICKKDNFGMWQVHLRCSELAMKYCFKY